MLHELVVSNMRGLRSQTVKFAGKSIVVCGPNGSGKSSVVDALDFLLTGRVRRLEGEGAGGLTLDAHGKHVDADAKDAWVKAIFLVGEPPKHFVVTRTLEGALTPEALPEPIASMFQRAAEVECHLLSRKEILKFILAAPKKRREHVGDLLRTSEIDEQRTHVSGAAKDAENAAKDARAEAEKAKSDMFGAFHPRLTMTDELLARVNAHRKILGGPPLVDFRPGELCEGVYPPSSRSVDPEATLEARVAALVESASAATIVSDADEYVRRASALNQTEARLAAQEKALLSAAEHLLDGDECPLCKSVVSMASLRAQWTERTEKVRAVAGEVEECRTRQSKLTSRIAQLLTGVRAVLKVVERDSPNFTVLERVVESLSKVSIPDPLGHAAIRSDEALTAGVASLLSLADSLRASAPPPSERSRADIAWTELQNAQAHALRMQEATKSAARKTAVSAFLKSAETAFLGVVEEVLNDIYGSIAERVEHLYSKIHSADGERRKTTLSSTRTGLAIEIDFYGRGDYPPSALHSEGQQDTLGICLFLALAERASGGTPPLLLLDDVLMSVDAEHRRKVAELLRDEFGTTQFLITTHDEVWAKHLKAAGVTQGRVNMDVWSIDGASAVPDEPRVAFAQMREDIKNGRIPTAAHTLRRTAESCLPDICESLGASVRYKADGKYDQGSFLAPIKTRFSELLKEAIKVAKSWGHDSTALESKLAAYVAVREQLGDEEWAVNAAVHFNAWANMTAEDFAPVVDAYEKFFEFFYCETCGSLLRATHGAVQCGCKKTVWNLEKKEK